MTPCQPDVLEVLFSLWLMAMLGGAVVVMAAAWPGGDEEDEL